MKWLPGPDYLRNNVAFRNDTILGICESLGQDLGINPNWLRVPLAAGIIFAPLAMVAIYLGLGLIAFASRALAPQRVETMAAPEAAPIPAASNSEVELPRAA